jgi:hypothetical protein
VRSGFILTRFRFPLLIVDHASDFSLLIKSVCLVFEDISSKFVLCAIRYAHLIPETGLDHPSPLDVFDGSGILQFLTSTSFRVGNEPENGTLKKRNRSRAPGPSIERNASSRVSSGLKTQKRFRSESPTVPKA